jgi:type I restriction enzyme S subunit
MVYTARKAYAPFMAWVLLSKYVLNGQIYLERMRAAQPHLNAEELGNFIVLLPPHPEQQAIADFLNHETGRIDSLIDKKQKLIELLKEKRTALISRAVTKGLNPRVKMKPSGVEWLGDVPKHWEVKKLKWIYRGIGSGDGISPDDIEPLGTYPVYGGNGIMGYAEKYNTTGEDIIIGRVGAKCGNVYLVDGQKWISDNALHLSIKRVCKKYIALVLEERNLNQLANQNAQPLITGSMVGNQFMPLPSLLEQKAIASFLDSETSKIDMLAAKVEAAIGKLKEYRTALISAAVTGKIAVMGN